MQDLSPNNFFFLNQEGRWPGFQWNGLERRDGGVLELASVPLFSGSLPEPVKTASAPDGPAGLAVDRFGSFTSAILSTIACRASTDAMALQGRSRALAARARS